MDELLRVDHLTHIYSVGLPFEKKAVDDVTFGVQKGEFVGLIGHTGSGKSTLIQHFNGLLKPTSGRVLIRGEDIHASKEIVRAARFAVGLVFQYPEHQLFEETVASDVAFGPKNMGLEREEVERRVRDAVASVGLPETILEESPFDLSGGEKRRVALAGVFAMEPEILVLDEPMAGLDPAGRADIFRLIREYHQRHGITVVFVTHSMEDAAKMATRLMVMKDGRIFMDGSPKEIFSRAAELTQVGLTVPQVTQVFLSLRARGIDIRTDVYTVGQAAEALIRYKGGDRPC